MAPATKKKTAMSDEHKEALALGREQSRAVRRYLEALERHRPRRGRKRTPDSIRRQLGGIEAKLAEADPLERLNLLQDRVDLQNELASMEEGVDLTALEEEFVKAAKPYSERKGITYSVWREVGVDPSVLRRAGIGRGTKV